MTGKIGIIADDLTGANDTAVQFAKQGLETIVLVDVGAMKDVVSDFDVIAVDTESRNAKDETASERAREAAKILRSMEAERVYKKIDSTLRGNIGIELEAVMSELDVQTCIFAPAFPANGRVVIDGNLLVNQIPLEKTEIADEGLKRFRTSHVPTILRSQTKLSVGHIPLSKVMQGIESLQNAIANLRQKDTRIIVIDAKTSRDLRVIARAAVASNSDRLMCGSAGLAETLPETFELHPWPPVLVVAGSLSSVTVEQIAKAREELDARVLSLDSSKILTEDDAQYEVQRVANEASRLLRSGSDVIIGSTGTMALTIRQERRVGMEKAEVMQRVVSVLGECASKILGDERISGLILTGGDTAIEVLRRMGGSGVKMIDEVLPGIPLGEVMGGKYHGLRIITKAGAFGKSLAISESIRHLRRTWTKN